MNTKEWLKVNSKYLRISVIEDSIGCPRYTLTKFISGERVLPEKWLLPLDNVIRDIVGGYVIDYSSGADAPVVKSVILESGVRSDNEPNIAVVDSYSVEKPMIGGIKKLPDHLKATKIVEEKEIKEETKKAVPIIVTDKLKWLFDPILTAGNVIDPWTREQDGYYEVWKWFGNRKKYTLVDSLEKVQLIKDASANKALNLIL